MSKTLTIEDIERESVSFNETYLSEWPIEMIVQPIAEIFKGNMDSDEIEPIKNAISTVLKKNEKKIIGKGFTIKCHKEKGKIFLVLYRIEASIGK